MTETAKAVIDRLQGEAGYATGGEVDRLVFSGLDVHEMLNEIEQAIDTDKLSVEKLQEIRVEELKDFNSKILQAELKNKELKKELDSCIQTLIEASVAASITQDIVVGNLVDKKIADLAKTHKLAVDYVEKVTGKNIDVVLAENAELEGSGDE
ncbi:prophage pi3 protein 34 [Lactococcus lactis subsp. lactis]|uniref:hypothetical protein n=1 Tax=Lactococcus lactis TaxID=1358 RepID=UPI00072ADD2E|nr:hypothetical protein [Lactococcus lactis]KST92519.1 prophage pi3 protein 34 [Lactococcus lactis subsp. lactis]